MIIVGAILGLIGAVGIAALFGYIIGWQLGRVEERERIVAYVQLRYRVRFQKSMGRPDNMEQGYQDALGAVADQIESGHASLHRARWYESAPPGGAKVLHHVDDSYGSGVGTPPPSERPPL